MAVLTYSLMLLTKMKLDNFLLKSKQDFILLRFDSNPDSTDSEGGSDASGSGGEKKEKKKKKEKEKKPKAAKTSVSK